MYSVMWSEHCSYKSSRAHLRRFPTEAPWVVVGPGENAGVVDLGDGWLAALRIESHNHPSFVEPYQGAATGVGGILRDVFTMGARPIALWDQIRFGPLDDPKNRYLFNGVVSGIAGYGNAVGVPTVGGEIEFDPCYSGNPLVNVMCLGILRREQLVLGTAGPPGTVAVLLGRATGRDGIGGASVLASASFDDESQEKRPSVQVGDPFEEKKLIEACLELYDRGLVAGVQDLGAAGLSCATSEPAGRAGVGLDVDLDAVHVRETGMTAPELLMSESQERMMAFVPPDHGRRGPRHRREMGDRLGRGGHRPGRRHAHRSSQGRDRGRGPSRLTGRRRTDLRPPDAPARLARRVVGHPGPGTRGRFSRHPPEAPRRPCPRLDGLGARAVRPHAVPQHRGWPWLRRRPDQDQGN